MESHVIEIRTQIDVDDDLDVLTLHLDLPLELVLDGAADGARRVHGGEGVAAARAVAGAPEGGNRGVSTSIAVGRRHELARELEDVVPCIEALLPLNTFNGTVQAVKTFFY